MRLGPLRQGALADLVHADPSTVSRHVAELVDQGLVRRVADETDGRASRLVVTDAGHRALDALRQEREAHLREITAGWSESDLTSFTTSVRSPARRPGCVPARRRRGAGIRSRSDRPERHPMTQSTRSRAAERRGARAAAAAPDASGSFTHRQILTILGGLVLGMFLAALDQTVVSTAIRTIADDLTATTCRRGRPRRS